MRWSISHAGAGFAICAAALAGCADNSSEVLSSQADADEITSACGAPASSLQVKGEEVVFKPDADVSYDVAACVLQAVHDSGKFDGKFGFVGNEKYRKSEGE